MSRDEYAEDLHAELGYRTAGQREVRQREWFSLRGEADEPLPTPAAFEKAVRALVVKRWKRTHRERTRELNRSWAHANREKANANVQRWRQRRRKAEARVYVCARLGCDVTWCRVPFAVASNARQLYCSASCSNRERKRRARRAGQP